MPDELDPPMTDAAGAIENLERMTHEALVHVARKHAMRGGRAPDYADFLLAEVFRRYCSERQRILTKVEEMVDAADEPIIRYRGIGIDPRATDIARRDGLLELLQWLQNEEMRDA